MTDWELVKCHKKWLAIIKATRAVKEAEVK